MKNHQIDLVIYKVIDRRYNLIFTNYGKIPKKEISSLDEIRTNRLEILDYLNK